MTFDDHVEKIGMLALTIFRGYDTFVLRETDKDFFLSLKRDFPVDDKSTITFNKRAVNVGPKPQLEFFKEFKDNSDETIVARGDSLAALEEQLELLKKERGNENE